MESKLDIAGEYYLQGVHEMASGVLLKDDSSFQFFFSYGALDRYGDGKWSIVNGQLVLNSANNLTNDFELLGSSESRGGIIIIKIEEQNPILKKHVYASLENGLPGSWMPADGNGEISFAAQEFENISLLLEFCPERITRIPVKIKGHDQFSFRMNPGIMEVIFNNFSLDIGDGQLKGRHPLLEGEQFIFRKSA